MPDAEPPPQLPMREALIRWCDPQLIERIKRIETDVHRDESRRRKLVRLSDHPGPAVEPNHDGLRVAGQALREIWGELLRDFRQRIERGEIFLLGVSTWPLPETERRPIPSLWAADFWFDVGENRVHVVQHGRTVHSYVAVTATSVQPRPKADPIDELLTLVMRTATGVARSEPSETAPIAPRAAPVQTIQTCVAAESATPTKRPKAKRGRKSCEAIIEEALREHWDLTEKHKRTNGLPVWIALANALWKRLNERRRRGWGGPVPKHGTIRLALPGLYARLLKEKTGQA